MNWAVEKYVHIQGRHASKLFYANLVVVIKGMTKSILGTNTSIPRQAGWRQPLKRKLLLRLRSVYLVVNEVGMA